MSAQNSHEMQAVQVNLSPSPIRAGWVLEGNPIARNKLLSVSNDGAARSYIWDCTAGRFNWFYEADETIYVIEGSVVVKDGSGVTRRLGAGDTFLFSAGARTEWHVESYIRKFAIIRSPLPWPLVLAKRGYQFLKRLTRKSGSPNPVPAMF
jgi:uncharacterized cupin superfamily protein